MKFDRVLLFFTFCLFKSYSQSRSTHIIEINFDFSFSKDKVRIEYLISPPPSKELFEYEFTPYNILQFRSYVLKPREITTYILNEKRLGIRHSGNQYHKYQFHTHTDINQLINDQLMTITDRGYQFNFSEVNFNKIFPYPVEGTSFYMISVCSDIKISTSGMPYKSFSDIKNSRECIFISKISDQEIKKIHFELERPEIISLARSADKQQSQTTQAQTDTEKVVSKANIQTIIDYYTPCNWMKLPEMDQCPQDSLILPMDFFSPFNNHYFLTAQKNNKYFTCLKSKLLLCQQDNSDVIQFLNAYDLILEILKEKGNQDQSLRIRNIVDNFSKNSGFKNAKRLYYVSLIYNIYFHNGLDGVNRLIKVFLSDFPNSDLSSVIQKLKLRTDLKVIDKKEDLTEVPKIFYELNSHIGSNGFIITLSDKNKLLKSGIHLTWILYLKNQKIDTLITTTTGEGIMSFEASSESEILFIYPQWEEAIMLPTQERRPDFHAILELNNGYTPLNRYRAFRTMISTGNSNLLATAVSLALDDSLDQIRSFGFERLDEVSENHINKVRDGLLRGIRISDAFTRPSAYRNAERLGLKVKRPVISDQKIQNLYADLLVLKQFEGPGAIDLALESFIEGNNDEGLIWFLAENGGEEVVDLLLTFEPGSDLMAVLKRLLVVYQAGTFSLIKGKTASLPDDNELFRRLISAGIEETDAIVLLKNLEVNRKLFKASFTNL